MIGNLAQRLLEFGRRRTIDEAKARDYVVSEASSVFREIMGDYDVFAAHLADVPESAFRIGTARDSGGREVPVRLEEEEFFTHQLIQGSTGSGKTSLAISLVSQAMERGLPVGVLDCKSGFYDLALSWAGAVAYRLPELERSEFIKRLVVVNPFSDDLVPFNVCHVMAGSSPEV
jgi:DNA helicase HerA-like ATPase